MSIYLQVIKKTKKEEPKVFPQLMLVDKEAFDDKGQAHTRFIMKEFWKSNNNKILVARKKETHSIIGYAIFTVNDPKDARFGKRVDSCYLLRIGVRINSQRQGVGKMMLNYLMQTYPEHALSLDVSTDNTKAVRFYTKMGLKISSIYLSQPDLVEFALFETPLDNKARRLDAGGDS